MDSIGVNRDYKIYEEIVGVDSQDSVGTFLRKSSGPQTLNPKSYRPSGPQTLNPKSYRPSGPQTLNPKSYRPNPKSYRPSGPQTLNPKSYRPSGPQTLNPKSCRSGGFCKSLRLLRSFSWRRGDRTAEIV